MSQSAPLDQLFQQRSALLQVVIAAVAVGLGVNLLSAVIAGQYENRNGLLLLLASSLLLLSIALIARLIIPRSKTKIELEGCFVLRKASNELVRIPRYDYSEDLASCMEGLFSENNAPKKLWESDPVHKSFDLNVETKTYKRRDTEAGRLVVEGTEYYVLEKLSTHLTDYFNKFDLEEKRIKTLEREDIPSILFKNRFLDTFSRPMRERAAFVEETEDASVVEHMVASFGPNGRRYSRFDLVLPAGARVERKSKNSIFVQTPVMKLQFEVDFSGFASNLPRGFEELYLGEAFDDLGAYMVKLDVEVEFRWWSIFLRTAWDYHLWLDSFLEKLEEDFDKAAYLRSIHWESALTVARLVQRTIASRPEGAARQPPSHGA